MKTNRPEDEEAGTELERLRAAGWEARPCICGMCGAGCGLLVLRRPGDPADASSVRIFPNPTHPQRGLCARGASALRVWNHPLRLRKPLRRTGERGEGRFEEVSWDEALEEIARRLRDIVDAHGERAVAMTAHTFTPVQKWFSAALGTPNCIGHSSACNSASVMGRRMVFGAGFESPGRMEPDYENCSFLLCVGRSLNSSMGAAAALEKARARGARVVFVDPRMPEHVHAGSGGWIPIRPGTDAAFLLSLIEVGVREELVDREFLALRTNAPYLIDESTGEPLRAPAPEGESAWLTLDRRTGRPVPAGVRLDDRGRVREFAEPEDLDPVLDFEGIVATEKGPVRAATCFSLLMREAEKFPPERAAEITGIPAQTIAETAREFFTCKGVADDGWYSSRNGNDTTVFQLLSVLNLLTGRLDQKGGLVVTQGAGFAGPSVTVRGREAGGPSGQRWELADGRSLDKLLYPESSGTFSALSEAIVHGRPYPVRALLVTGTTLLHREADTARLEGMLRALDLVVVQDVFPHEVTDWADFVLPCTYFLEREGVEGVRWARDGHVQLNAAGLTPPAGNDSRDELWQLCEILRRGWPERARDRLGYDREMTPEEFRAWHAELGERAWTRFLGMKEAEHPGDAARIAAELERQGWARTAAKVFGTYPYRRPFGTPTGKPEILSFRVRELHEGRGLSALPTWVPAPGWTAPRPGTDEFVLVSGKDAAASSGTAMFTLPQKFLGDRRVWMHPEDAGRLGIPDGAAIELESLDTGVRERARVRVTSRVMSGCLFAFAFQGGVRTRNLPPAWDWVREGMNSHRLCTGYREPVTGSLSNNCSVRVRLIEEKSS